MAGYAVKARVSKDYRKKSGIAILIVAFLSCVGLALCIYSFIRGSYLFAISYLCAIILGFTYVIIRYNAVFVTYAALDKQSIFMRNWTNGFFPYNIETRLKIFSEFIPAKTVLTEASINDIEAIAIGTKNFIKKNLLPGEKFLERLERTERLVSRSKAKQILSMDLLYVKTHKGSGMFMPVTNFSKRDVIKLIQLARRKNPDIEVTIGSRSFRTYMSRTRVKGENM